MVETLAKANGKGDSRFMEARVAVLEQMAADTRETLKEIKISLVRREDHQRSGFRLLLSAGTAAVLASAALLAHGFHWL